MFIAVTIFRDHFYVSKYIKPYKIVYIEDFIMKIQQTNFPIIIL